MVAAVSLRLSALLCPIGPISHRRIGQRRQGQLGLKGLAWWLVEAWQAPVAGTSELSVWHRDGARNCSVLG